MSFEPGRIMKAEVVRVEPDNLVCIYKKAYEVSAFVMFVVKKSSAIMI